MSKIISLSLSKRGGTTEDKYYLNMSILEGNKVINVHPLKAQNIEVFKEEIKKKYNPENLEEKFSEIKKDNIKLSTIQHFIDKEKDFIFIFDVFSEEEGFEEVLLCKMKDNEFNFNKVSIKESNSFVAIEVSKILEFSESNCIILDGSFRLHGEDYIFTYKDWENYIKKVKKILNETRDIRKVDKLVNELSNIF